MAKATISYRDLLDTATQQLFDISDSPRIDAEVLLQHVIKKPMAWLIAYGDTIATADHIRDFMLLTDARTMGKPIAYLTGHREFWSLDLEVNEAVLVPRADTETLVEAALVALQGNPNPSILDLGTGSGAVALSLAKEKPEAKVNAVDVSKDALAVASSNAERNGLTNVTFCQSVWYQNIGDAKFDLIASNPPYVAPNDPHLERGDLRFEPDIALTANDNGFADLKHIIQTAPHYLKPGGVLIVEHGFQQHQDVQRFFREASFSDVQTHVDINELPRCTQGALDIQGVHSPKERIHEN